MFDGVMERPSLLLPRASLLFKPRQPLYGLCGVRIAWWAIVSKDCWVTDFAWRLDRGVMDFAVLMVRVRCEFCMMVTSRVLLVGEENRRVAARFGWFCSASFD
jgi:hypothetical protein